MAYEVALRPSSAVIYPVATQSKNVATSPAAIKQIVIARAKQAVSVYAEPQKPATTLEAVDKFIDKQTEYWNEELIQAKTSILGFKLNINANRVVDFINSEFDRDLKKEIKSLNKDMKKQVNDTIRLAANVLVERFAEEKKSLQELRANASQPRVAGTGF